MEPKITEVFNQQRMDRCLTVQRSIMDNWRKHNSLNYRVTCAESLNGKTINELQALYFGVGIGDHLTDLPLIDMLIVFTAIAEESKQLAEKKHQSDFTINLTLKTEFSESEVFALLRTLRVEQVDR